MKSILKAFSAFVSVLFFYSSIAQIPTANPMQPFLDLKGNWIARVDFTFGESLVSATYQMDFERASDNSGVVMFEKTTIPGIGTLMGSNLIGYDPFDGKYHWFSVDNFGTTHDHTGLFSDATHFYMEHNSAREGKAFHEKIWIDWLDEHTLKLKLIASTDGTVEQIAEGIFKRKNKGNSN